MNTHHPRATRQPAGQEPHWPGAYGSAADLPRQLMAVAGEAACATLRGLEAIRNVQIEAARQSFAHHNDAFARLRQPLAPGALLAVQAELLQSDFAEATAYWQQLAAAALEMQAELAGCGTHLVSADTLLESAHQLEP